MYTIRPEDFEPLPSERRAELMQRFGQAPFARLAGLVAEDVRADYARMRLPYRPELNQPAGIVHGGAIATLIDTSVVGAIFSTLATLPRRLATVDMHIQYLAPAREHDLIAHAAVTKRGRSTVFLAVEVTTPDGKIIARASLTYRVVVE